MPRKVDEFDLILVTVVLVIAIFYIAFTDTGYIRDLQRRVGELEMKVK